MKRFLSLKSRGAILIASTAMFMVQLDASVLAVAIPQISADFGLPAIELSLAITIYLTMQIALLPISGWAAERFGPKTVFMIATAGFAFFSICCAAAPSFWPFIAARALQGATASLMTPVARLLLLRQTSKEELVDAMAIVAMPMLIAPTLGPSIGGFIVQYARWEFIFLLNIPVTVALLLAAWRTIPASAPDASRRLDMVGAALLGGSLVCLLTGFDRLASGVGRPLPWILLAVGTVLCLAGLKHIRTHPDPVLKLDALKDSSFRTTVIGAGAIVRIPARAMLFGLPLMFQMAYGFTPILAGVMLMALNGGDLLAKLFIRPLFDRFGFSGPVMLSSFAGLAAIAVVALADQGPWLAALIFVALLVAGLARSVLFTGMTSLTYVSLDADTMTQGNVLASISMQLFAALAVSLTALLLGLLTQFAGHPEPGLMEYRGAMLAVALIGLVATLLMRRRIPRHLSQLAVRDED
ncbi:EmrB/QacA subfamily drug resistance transporter [Sphingobium sp. B1D7B]|uniref:MFS transporter n=1 Tax=unclassified Sphingobium TaxID=2611147 RepID=UPI002225A451|nr:MULTISPECIES: MFS transporter [unclassified Sphingobium]MCW2391274.1 EmrB/QacA subfamily drug resistance transporter [Sphingobium sp. B11D3A]MCW2406485.1 EmrB/QacA subfamily drug resistance transporter [Sphingobium sp. B1D7B]